MLQYLVILLDNTSTSYCHYENTCHEKKLISIEDLNQGIFYGMKENLMIQFVYPNYELPQEYKEIIDTIDHSDIVSSSCEDDELRKNADVIIHHDWNGIQFSSFDKDRIYTLRTSKEDLFDRYKLIKDIISFSRRLNIVITDIENFTEEDFNKYKEVLVYLSDVLKTCYLEGKSPQLNILTDRMMLNGMNNCNAGVENITLAPNGKFYICPAFYLSKECDGTEKSLDEVCQKGYSIGSLKEGLDIKNPQLYKLDHAPICRNCDAYQCKRCVWLNRKTTLEVNTPSHEQCVVAHLERNASSKLLKDIRKHGSFLPEHEEIKDIDYIDPYEKREEW